MHSRVSSASVEPQDRKSKILKAVIDLYLVDANPVGSRAISEKVDLGVSSATIRNGMHALEEEGFLSHTHTSSGRIPTDLGYRYFVDNFVATQTNAENKKLEKESFFRNLSIKLFSRNSSHLLEDMVVMLSTLTQLTAVVVKETPNLSKVCDVHVSVLEEGRLVIGLFFEDATIERVVINLNQFGQPLQSQLLNESHESLREKCEAVLKGDLIGQSMQSNRENFVNNVDMLPLTKELLTFIFNSSIPNLNSNSKNGVVHVAGVANIAKMTESQFEDREISTRLLSLVEEHMTLVELIRNSLGEKIDAKIGSENELEELHFHSLVLAPIKASDGLTGAVGVIGPKRMDYLKVFKYTDALSKIVQEKMEN